MGGRSSGSGFRAGGNNPTAALTKEQAQRAIYQASWDTDSTGAVTTLDIPGVGSAKAQTRYNTIGTTVTVTVYDKDGNPIDSEMFAAGGFVAHLNGQVKAWVSRQMFKIANRLP